ncbi:hypothetical protein H5410_018095 [Solanum commersonii]|uniref:Uncharacterized protein n=1 Tax=Solanum commersonii TaxID=4109 RepID=A0A9J6A2C3_SOLCO|nr:hypothetical protein H5410_018095 [Solanum commersonii]
MDEQSNTATSSKTFGPWEPYLFRRAHIGNQILQTEKTKTAPSHITVARLTALKRAYADIILNTAKEAAARIMSSEQKAVRYKHELQVAKEEGLGMLLRLKQMMDSKFKHLSFFLPIPFLVFWPGVVVRMETLALHLLAESEINCLRLCGNILLDSVLPFLSFSLSLGLVLVEVGKEVPGGIVEVHASCPKDHLEKTATAWFQAGIACLPTCLCVPFLIMGSLALSKGMPSVMGSRNYNATN